MRKHARFFKMALFVVALLAIMGQTNVNNFQAERVFGQGCSSAASNSFTVNIGGVPSTGILRYELEIPGYGAPGDTLAYRFNGDTGNNYRYEWLSAAPGGTTFAPGNTASSTDRIKLGAADTQNPRLIHGTILDLASKTEKIVWINDVTGTGSAATQANFDLGNGGWISAASTNITSITLMTSNANMAAKTCLVVYGR